jgi:hypothetical protein
MDPFVLVLIVAFVAFVLWVAVLGRHAPGSGLEQLGLRSANEISERRASLEADDLAEMVEARNARRRARGEAEVSADDIEMQVMADINAQRRRDREQAMARKAQSAAQTEADRELDELLEATNARRRARGLPERTREEAMREFDA